MSKTRVRCLAASVAGAALLIGATALAADVPTKKGPPPAPVPIVPPVTWTGFYVSLESGYAWDGSIVYVGDWNKGFGDTGPFGAPMSATIIKSGRSLSARKPAMISPTSKATPTPIPML